MNKGMTKIFINTVLLSTILFLTNGFAESKKNIESNDANRNKSSYERPANLDRNDLLILIRSTLTALDHANKTGNYGTFRDLGAPSFILNNDPSALSQIFYKLRLDRVDMSGVLIHEPTIITQIYRDDGMLNISGYFPSGIGRLNFEILYAPVNGSWRVYGISAGVGPSTPSAPTSTNTQTTKPNEQDK